MVSPLFGVFFFKGGLPGGLFPRVLGSLGCCSKGPFLETWRGLFLNFFPGALRGFKLSPRGMPYNLFIEEGPFKGSFYNPQGFLIIYNRL